MTSGRVRANRRTGKGLIVDKHLNKLLLRVNPANDFKNVPRTAACIYSRRIIPLQLAHATESLLPPQNYSYPAVARSRFPANNPNNKNKRKEPVSSEFQLRFRALANCLSAPVD